MEPQEPKEFVVEFQNVIWNDVKPRKDLPTSYLCCVEAPTKQKALFRAKIKAFEQFGVAIKDYEDLSIEPVYPMTREPYQEPLNLRVNEAHNNNNKGMKITLKELKQIIKEEIKALGEDKKNYYIKATVIYDISGLWPTGKELPEESKKTGILPTGETWFDKWFIQEEGVDHNEAVDKAKAEIEEETGRKVLAFRDLKIKQVPRDESCSCKPREEYNEHDRCACGPRGK